MRKIRRVVVLGAGLMGSQIAAHLANVGIASHLLDVVPRDPAADRNLLAQTALKKLREAKPSPVYTRDVLSLITPGNFDDHLGVVAGASWVIEAVVENLAIKQDLWSKVEAHWKPGTIVSTNTSGIPVADVAAKNSPDFRRHFLGTHFFNPPRYMKLLEVIPTPETDPGILEFFRHFGERSLGKGVVLAKDTPNFIANRIGTYGLMVTLEAMREGGLGVDEVDAITGPAMGRPKTATFRTLDLVGLDVFLHVADHAAEAVSEAWEKKAFRVPDFMREMLKRGWLGNKSGQGFYQKVKPASGSGGGSGEKEVLVFDPATLDYRPKKRVSFASLEAAKATPDLKSKLRTLVYNEDRAGRFAWSVLKKVLLYAAGKLGEIAGDALSVDQAMKWGFGWELGPFETWDAIGLKKSVERMQKEGETVPAFVLELLANGRHSFYDGEPDRGPLVISLAKLKGQESAPGRSRIIKSNPGASLVDIGDEVACLELHSPKAAIGTDIINLMKFTAREVAANWRGLVVAGSGPNFCVGANLMLVLMEAEDDEWDEVDRMVREFQNAATTMKYLERPVVAAPYGMTLGGGVEICFGADRIQAAAETYLGLVEVGAGLIPAGGGCKEMLYRALEGIPEAARSTVDLQPLVNRAFETIATAKVSTSGPEAKSFGYLRPADGITVNGDHLIHDAKQVVLALDRTGYRPPKSEPVPVLGPSGRAVLEIGVYGLKNSGYISQHDALIGQKLAHVITGGNVASGTLVTEQYLLDLEREAFLSLCGEPKTQARMRHLLSQGKPLRN